MNKYVLIFTFSFFCLGAFAQNSVSLNSYSIPFRLTSSNNISIRAVLNEKDTLNLMFHTSASDLTITTEAINRLKTVNFTRTDTLKSWGGDANAARFSGNNSLAIGKQKWEGMKIWENKNSGPETDGKFGLDLFDDQVIEIDFDKSVMTISTDLPKKADAFTKVKLNYNDGMMFIEARSNIGTEELSNQFLIHSGYAGSVLFDDGFTNRHKLSDQLKVISEKSLKDSYGNVLKTKKAIMPMLILAGVELKDISVGFFQGAIGQQKMSILGGDVIKRFNMIIDAKRNYIYLKKNKLSKQPYTDV